MAKVRLKKGDQVKVLTGKDKDRIGKVIRVYPEKDRVLVEKVNMVKRHTRPNPQKGVKGGITPKEAPLHISNVMFICPQCQKPTRIGYSALQDGRKARTCKVSGDVLD